MKTLKKYQIYEGRDGRRYAPQSQIHNKGGSCAIIEVIEDGKFKHVVMSVNDIRKVLGIKQKEIEII